MKTVRMSRRRFLRATASAAVFAPFVARGAATDGFQIGLVADAQYADIESKGTRFYRESLPRLGAAVDDFNARDLAFCVHLGDLIDRDWNSFDDITKPLATSRHRWHHLLGNHDFEVLDTQKPKVPERMGMRARYYTYDHGAFCFAVLDTNDVSTYAHASGSPERAAAESELAHLLAAKRPQAKPWNGGIGPEQLRWLDRTCAAARNANRKVIVFAHHPVFPVGGHNAWNASEILAVLDRHPHVVAWLNGHNHAGAFGERNGVPFLTLRGMVETRETSAFANAQILADRIILTGHEREPSREMKFRS